MRALYDSREATNTSLFGLILSIYATICFTATEFPLVSKLTDPSNRPVPKSNTAKFSPRLFNDLSSPLTLMDARALAQVPLAGASSQPVAIICSLSTAGR